MTSINFYFSESINQETRLLCEDKVQLFMNAYNLSPENFEMCIFTFGGDGTFIDAFSHFGCQYTYIPVNMGSLGFYTSWSFDNMELIFSEFEAQKIMHAPLLDVEVCDDERICHSYTCINEATIINPTQTQVATITINEIPFEYFRGTGLCVSTPTGSTAYNKSLNGSIIDPSKDLFQLVKIAPINNNIYRTLSNPIIFDRNDRLVISSEDVSALNSLLTIDRQNHNLKNVNKITFTLSQKKAKILIRSDISFWNRVESSFL